MQACRVQGAGCRVQDALMGKYDAWLHAAHREKQVAAGPLGIWLVATHIPMSKMQIRLQTVRFAPATVHHSIRDHTASGTARHQGLHGTAGTAHMNMNVAYADMPTCTASGPSASGPVLPNHLLALMQKASMIKVAPGPASQRCLLALLASAVSWPC